MTLANGFVHELRLFFVALQFLTRLPVPRWVGHESGWLNECVRHFPTVGAFVGIFGAVVMHLAVPWWPPLVVAALTVSATVWLTGAFHEDGLADTFDALGGAVSRDRRAAVAVIDAGPGTDAEVKPRVEKLRRLAGSFHEAGASLQWHANARGRAVCPHCRN